MVFDVGGEIFDEYKSHLSFRGQPGVGDSFFKWFNDVRWSFPDTEKIKLHKTEIGYSEFPAEMEQANVDMSDKKFFAVSNAHSEKPVILEAVDTKLFFYGSRATI